MIKENIASKSGGGLYILSSELVFDTVNKSSIFKNIAPVGHDIFVFDPSEIVSIQLDTFSVKYPTDFHVEPVKYFDFDIDHGLYQQVDASLYVSPSGNNSNSGLTKEDPLQNIQYALSIIRGGPLHSNQIHLLPGIYSSTENQEYFPINIPDYCDILGVKATEVELNAEFWGNVLTFNENEENTIDNITLTG
ncbi:MAG: DUF1565 domain-containing protein, partial [Bacteroidales bacterium]|nr:DUF1565 domain-containing protein [Bacteroidales bacterium]